MGLTYVKWFRPDLDISLDIDSLENEFFRFREWVLNDVFKT